MITAETVGVNSYVTFADATEIAATRLFTSAWDAANGGDQAKALMTATALLDRLHWQGRKVLPTQSLAWPRVADNCPPGYPLTTEVPSAIIIATVELAIHLLATGSIPSGIAVQLEMIGQSMQTNFAHVGDEFPKHVRRLIEPYLRATSANVAEVRF